jgi:hypothetical protein
MISFARQRACDRRYPRIVRNPEADILPLYISVTEACTFDNMLSELFHRDPTGSRRIVTAVLVPRTCVANGEDLSMTTSEGRRRVYQYIIIQGRYGC